MLFPQLESEANVSGVRPTPGEKPQTSTTKTQTNTQRTTTCTNNTQKHTQQKQNKTQITTTNTQIFLTPVPSTPKWIFPSSYWRFRRLQMRVDGTGVRPTPEKTHTTKHTTCTPNNKNTIQTQKTTKQQKAQQKRNKHNNWFPPRRLPFKAGRFFPPTKKGSSALTFCLVQQLPHRPRAVYLNNKKGLSITKT